MKSCDVVIIGAGAAGLMCARQAGLRHRKVIVLDHSNKAGKKILMSGGGRCNFTNTGTEAECFISHNPHFCKSALSRYTPYDFIEMVQSHDIPFHEKKLGQLFCDNKSKDILNMLLNECHQINAQINLNTEIKSIKQNDDHSFNIQTNYGSYHSQSLVIATGGLSIPTMGASPFGYEIAKQFGIKVWPVSAGLVPLTLHADDKSRFEPLSGVSSPCRVACGHMSFEEDMLFTHRGLSGPAMLQISSYWTPGNPIHLSLQPDKPIEAHFQTMKTKRPKLSLGNALHELFPRKLLDVFLEDIDTTITLANCPQSIIKKVAKTLQAIEITPNNTEGYRTAEVTLGGVDTNALSSQTMEVKNTPGLYFIGECCDVTGWLGGYNFQWAWASGVAAGKHV